MDKIQEMVAAMSEAAAQYAVEHGLDNNEVMNALAHLYVIFGFTVKKEDTDPQVLKDALVECVEASCDIMMGADADAQEA